MYRRALYGYVLGKEDDHRMFFQGHPLCLICSMNGKAWVRVTFIIPTCESQWITLVKFVVIADSLFPLADDEHGRLAIAYLSQDDWVNRCHVCRKRALGRLIYSEQDPDLLICDAHSFLQANKRACLEKAEARKAQKKKADDTVEHVASGCSCLGRQAVLYAPIFDEDVHTAMFSPAHSVKQCVLLALAPPLLKFYRHCSSHNRCSAPPPLSSFGSQKYDGRKKKYGLCVTVLDRFII